MISPAYYTCDALPCAPRVRAGKQTKCRVDRRPFDGCRPFCQAREHGRRRPLVHLWRHVHGRYGKLNGGGDFRWFLGLPTRPPHGACVQVSKGNRVDCRSLFIGWSALGRAIGAGSQPRRLPSLGLGLEDLVALVHVVSRSISPQWGSVRFRLAPHTYAPRGVRVVSLAKSRKSPLERYYRPFLDQAGLLSCSYMSTAYLPTLADGSAARPVRA